MSDLSKTPSTSLPPEVPADDRPVLVLDQTFSSPKLKAILEAAPDWRVVLHKDHFPPDAKDHEWIPECGRRGWLILSCDKRMRTWTAEDGLARRAAMESRAKIFFCTSGGRPLSDYGYCVGNARKKILNLARKSHGPLFAKIRNDGTLIELERDKKTETKRQRTMRKYGKVG